MSKRSRGRSRAASSRPWNPADEALLRALYPKTRTDELPKRLGRSRSAINNRAAALHLRKHAAASMRRRWTADEDAALRACYADTLSEDIARRFGRRLSSVHNRAGKLGLHKSAAFVADAARDRIRREGHGARAHQFKKGIVPANKGTRRPGWGPGRMKETQFKKGQSGHNWRPVGATRLCDGYVYRKTSDIRCVLWTRNWRLEHFLVWEAANGPVPRGYALAFKDRDRLNTTLENLELITRAENMRRNTIHHLPQPLKRTIRMLASLNRTIRRRKREEQDRRLA